MTAVAAPVLAVQWDTSGNAGTDDTIDFLGTTDGEALVIKVNDVHAGRFEPAGTPRTIFGFEGNDQTSGIGGALVGGGLSGTPNTVTDNFGVIVGGRGNQAGNAGGTVIDASFATVVGGFGNTAAGQLSTVLGGQLNQANGDASIAAGQAAVADHDGAIVFADASTTDAFASDRANQVKFRAVGGFQVNNADGRVFEIAPAASTVNIIAGNPNNAVFDGQGNVIAGGGDDEIAGAEHTICDGNTGCDFNTISGGIGNNICIGGGACIASTISGGLANDICNGGGVCDYGAIGGGASNGICNGGSGCPENTIGGGGDNDICAGGNFCGWSTIGGGTHNDVCFGGSSCAASTISGGDSNDICDGSDFCDRSTIGGGLANDICSPGHSDCDYSTIPGGRENEVNADYGFAAGRRAHAEHDGAFVWADSTDADFSSQAADQFSARAGGGVRFLSGATKCVFGSGDTDWTCTSDRHVKNDHGVVDSQEALTALAQVPIHRWSLKTHPDVVHVGPFAQDVHAAFDLSGDETSLNGMDLDGLQIAAIQGVYEQNRELAKQNQQLLERIEALEQTSRANVDSGPSIDPGVAYVSGETTGEPVLGTAGAIAVAMALVALAGAMLGSVIVLRRR